MVCMADTQPEANAPSLSTLPNCLKLEHNVQVKIRPSLKCTTLPILPNCLKLEHNVQAKIQLSLSCTAALIPTNFLKMKRKDSCTSQNPAESVYYRSVYSAKNVWNFNIMFKSKLNTKFAHYSCVHSAKLPDIWMNQSNPCYVPVKIILSLICTLQPCPFSRIEI